MSPERSSIRSHHIADTIHWAQTGPEKAIFNTLHANNHTLGIRGRTYFLAAEKAHQSVLRRRCMSARPLCNVGGSTETAEYIQFWMTVNRHRTTASVAFNLVIALLVLSPGCMAQTPTAISRGGSGYELSGTYTHVITDGAFGTPLGMNGGTA